VSAQAVSFRARLFVSIGRLSARLPPFRGRTRFFLELYRLLRVHREHVSVLTSLRDPVACNVRLDLHSWLQRIAFLTGGYEADTVRFLLALRDAAKPNGYLLDVGANVGLITIPFAIAGNANVVCAEAVPDNVRALEQNLALNPLSGRVRILPAALGDEERISFIQVEGDLVAGEGTGTANILPEGSTYECVRQEVRVRKLDSLMAGGEVPAGCSIMKIDADGYDLKVLQGGTAFLARERPVIFGEFAAHCLGWHGQTLADVRTFAAENGFAVWRRLLPGMRFSERLDGIRFEQDLLLVPDELRTKLAGFLVSE
jgi:FkbM family methyltransferase